MRATPDPGPRRTTTGRGSRWGALPSALLVCLGAALAGGGAALAESAEPAQLDEYRVKGAFLFKFLYFTEWPEKRFDSEDDPIVLAVLDPDPFGESLEEMVRGKRVGERAILVERFDDPEDLRPCHVLFVPEEAARHQERILRATRRWSTLVVGEIPGFAARGGIVNFYIEEGKVRFEVNPDAARRFDLSLSSKLLKLARIVRDEGGPR